ncbi:MAG: hypothetical protein KKF48_02930 [Nanoarchaeota archaeon]|nr:hypothetical protein [Nanoarchaeota archaeon]MBU1027977.1 hypothetical protein [Nanoarchaeota archaeon]
MVEQKQESERKVNLVSLPAQQFVIPNSQEIDLSVQCNRQISNMPYAVKCFKFTTRNTDKFNIIGAREQRDGYREICKKYPRSKFLLHIQVKEGTEFTTSQMNFIENVQNIQETPFFCSYEKSFRQTAREFEEQILEAKEKYPKKEIVPAVEVYTEFNAEKVAIMKKHGIKKCVIIYRNYQIHEFSWMELMGALDTADISRFVFGVTPRYRRKNKATILLAPLRFGANYVAHGLPWSGGKGQVYILGNSWIYNVTQNSTYPASRVQALNKVNTLTPQIQSLSIQQIETLLN